MSDYRTCIIQSCYINNFSIYDNGVLIFNSQSEDFVSFAENAYRHFSISYPKFHKMDNLSKLGFLASEILLKNLDLTKYEPERIAINIINKNSSIDTDIKYNNLLQKGTSSPAIFVYSLPNIMIGEICIRHKIKGDNLIFISDKYDTELNFSYTSSLFNTNIADVSICGYVDYCDNAYEAFLFIVEKDNRDVFLPFTNHTVNQLYKTISNEHRGIGTAT